MEIFKVSFVGHREIRGSFLKIEARIRAILLQLLSEKKFVEFYLGRNGDFDLTVACVLKEFKRKKIKSNYKAVLVLPYETKDFDYREEGFDEVIYPLEKKVHYKAAIIKRNQWLVDNTHFLITYVERNRGGAYKTARYARKRGQIMRNLAIDDFS